MIAIQKLFSKDVKSTPKPIKESSIYNSRNYKNMIYSLRIGGLDH